MNWFKSFWKKLASPASTHETAETSKHNFIPRAVEMLALAQKESERLNHNFIGTEHALLGLLRLDQGIAVALLKDQGLDLEIARQEVEKEVGLFVGPPWTGKFLYTPRLKEVLALAIQETRALNNPRIGPEHILLGILRDGGGVAVRIMKKQDIDLQNVQNEIMKRFGQIPPAAADAQKPPQNPPA